MARAYGLDTRGWSRAELERWESGISVARGYERLHSSEIYDLSQGEVADLAMLVFDDRQRAEDYAFAVAMKKAEPQ